MDVFGEQMPGRIGLRKSPGGHLSTNGRGYFVEICAVIACLVGAGQVAAQDSTWVRTGGPLGGLGYDVRIHPDDHDLMYVTDNFAGVFRSFDGAETWSPASTGITVRTGSSGDTIPVFCLTIDPNDHDIIWCGTDQMRGIFKSTDRGDTWVEMNNGVVEEEGITFRGFTVEPGNSDIVYAAGEIASWVWSDEGESPGREFDMTQGVVYKTTDGGQNWSAAWRGNNLARYVWIDPRNTDVLYVSTGIFDREAANSDPDSADKSGAAGGVGVIKSTDAGQTWSEINNGLNNLYVGSLFMHPDDPDILLAGTGNNQYHQNAGVYLTTDGGATWEDVGIGDIINAVEFAVVNSQIAYAGSNSAIYRSEDGGLSWERVSSEEYGWGSAGIRAGFPIDFQVDPNDPDRIFVNNYGGGVFLSADGGQTWTAASTGYTGAQVRDVAVDPTAPGLVFAAARSGLFASYNGGEEWIGRSFPPGDVLEWYVVALDPSDSQHILAANNWNAAILESHDAARSWQQRTPGAEEGMSWRAISFAPSAPQTVYAGMSAFYSAGTFDERLDAGGIYVSHDGGAAWAEANDAASQNANVTALVVDPDDAQVVYAATGNLGMLKTTDGGQNWNSTNDGLPGAPRALAIAMDPNDSSVFLVGLDLAGVYRSEDGGATWRSSSAGLNAEAKIADVVFDPTDAQTVYAADRFSGVYHSSDGGATWTQLTDGLRTRDVNALAISTDGEHLYAATEGEGVYRLDLAGEPPPATDEPDEDDADLGGDGGSNGIEDDDNPIDADDDNDDGDADEDDNDLDGDGGSDVIEDGDDGDAGGDDADDGDQDPDDDGRASGGGSRGGSPCGVGIVFPFVGLALFAIWSKHWRF